MQVDERVVFKFNSNKKRRYDDEKAVYRRFEEQTGEKVTKKLLQTAQKHHKDLDRENGHPDNIFLTRNQHEHNELHNQLHQANSEMIKSGVIGFDWRDKKYFIAFKPLADWIRRWRELGNPSWHQDEGRLSKNIDFLKQMHESLFEPKKTAS